MKNEKLLLGTLSAIMCLVPEVCGMYTWKYLVQDQKGIDTQRVSKHNAEVNAEKYNAEPPATTTTSGSSSSSSSSSSSPSSSSSRSVEDLIEYGYSEDTARNLAAIQDDENASTLKVWSALGTYKSEIEKNPLGELHPDCRAMALNLVNLWSACTSRCDIELVWRMCLDHGPSYNNTDRPSIENGFGAVSRYPDLLANPPFTVGKMKLAEEILDRLVETLHDPTSLDLRTLWNLEFYTEHTARYIWMVDYNRSEKYWIQSPKLLCQEDIKS